MIVASRPFNIDAAGTTILADAADYRERFRSVPAILLDGVFAPPLIDRLVARGEAAKFAPKDVARVGVREVTDDAGIGAVLAILLGRDPLRRWLADVTGSPPLSGVVGSFSQASAGTGDGLAWHDDLIDPRRRLGVVVNLTRQPYEGGLFELRRKGSAAPLLSHHHDRPGMTLIFAVGCDLEHRVTPVISGGPRRVFAGWFLVAENHLG